MIHFIAIIILLGMFGTFFWGIYAIRQINTRAIDINSIKTSAKKLGVNDQQLKQSTGSVETDYYSLLQKVRFEESFRLTQSSFIFAIIAAVAAIVAASSAALVLFLK